MARARNRDNELGQELARSYAASERMNQMVIEQLDPRAWRGKLAGERARTIAAIFSHVHNMRRKWLRLSAPHLELPAALDRVTMPGGTAAAASKLIQDSLTISSQGQAASAAVDSDGDHDGR